MRDVGAVERVEFVRGAEAETVETEVNESDEDGTEGGREADISVSDATGETGLGRRDCRRDCRDRFRQGRATGGVTGRSNRRQQTTGNATTACNKRRVRINIIVITEVSINKINKKVSINKINKKVSINKTRQHTTATAHAYKSNAIAPWSPMWWNESVRCALWHDCMRGRAHRRLKHYLTT